MAYQVILSGAAHRDMEDVLAWFDANKVSQAKQDWHDALLQKLLALESTPTQWPLAVEAQDLGIELRELLFGRRRNVYRILFLVATNQVRVVRIRHSAMDSLKAGDV